MVNTVITYYTEHPNNALFRSYTALITICVTQDSVAWHVHLNGKAELLMQCDDVMTQRSDMYCMAATQTYSFFSQGVGSIQTETTVVWYQYTYIGAPSL